MPSRSGSRNQRRPAYFFLPFFAATFLAGFAVLALAEEAFLVVLPLGAALWAAAVPADFLPAGLPNTLSHLAENSGDGPERTIGPPI
jgi:hypothetical protein